MFEFLKKPHHPDISHGNDREVAIESSDEPHGEDVGQIAVDILETREGYLVIAPLAGVPRSDVDVNISRNVLTISGNRPEPDIYAEAYKVPVKECFYGAFSRSIILPENLALDTIRATIERGMLIITIPYLIIDARTVKVEHIEDIEE